MLVVVYIYVRIKWKNVIFVCVWNVVIKWKVVLYFERINYIGGCGWWYEYVIMVDILVIIIYFFYFNYVFVVELDSGEVFMV